MSALSFIRWSEALEGAKVACKNAIRLADDAFRLQGIESYLTAFSLSILAWEETNKAGLLKAYVDHRDISESEWRGKFANHKSKLAAYSEYHNILYPASRTLPDDSGASKRMKEIAGQLDIEKQLFGFYTDFVQHSRRWLSPTTQEKPSRFLLRTLI
jgi:AbiV family abortive infection protein